MQALSSAAHPRSLPVSSRRAVLLTPPLIAASLAYGASSSTPRAMAATTLPAVPKIDLASDLSISRVIKGCWQLSGGHAGDRDSDRTSGSGAVDDFQPFVDAGITTFDTADIYGPSEGIIGKYLASHSDAKDQCQVLTKFCCFGDAMRRAGDAAFVEESIDNSRKKLGVDKLDLVQFYWHDYGNKNYVKAALHLAELQAKGKIAHVGVTNFDVPRLKEMVDAGVNIVSNQVQYSLLDRRPENEMVEYCKQHGIGLLPYGTVAGGFLSDKYIGVDPNSVRLTTYSLQKYASVINKVGGWDYLQDLLAALQGIASKHGVSVSDIASKWVLSQPQVPAIIVGARNARHVADHQRLFSFDLDQEDYGKINEVLAKGVKPASDCYTWERGGQW